MKTLTSRRCVIGLIVWLVCQTASIAHANQDTLSKARELYLAADYEGALAVLDRLEAAPDSRADVADYRVFCLLALDRTDEAREAIKGIVELDPFHQLSEVQASPRMRAVFQETRKELLPDVVHRMYGEAKASFDKHDPAAVHQFDRLMALLDDPDLKNAQLSDLRAVASGFRDLSKGASVERGDPSDVRLPPSRPEGATARLAEASGGGRKPDTTNPDEQARLKPDTTYDRAAKPDTTYDPPEAGARVAPKPTAPLTGPPDKFRVTTKGASPLFTPKEPPPPGLEPPLAISQPMPGWSPRGQAAQQNYVGVLEITIDEQGKVTTVALQQPMQPAFDKALLKAARTWKYKPALLNGTPVSFLKVIEIHIQSDR